MTDSNNTIPLNKLNQVGCIDGLQERISKIEGLSAALETGIHGLDDRLAQACLWNIRTLAEESSRISERLYEILPRQSD